MSVDIKDRIDALAARHGSIRAAARVLDIDHTHLWRIRKGEKVPSQALARKLGLRKTVHIVYEPIGAKS
jgi:hypothetical protein